MRLLFFGYIHLIDEDMIRLLPCNDVPTRAMLLSLIPIYMAHIKSSEGYDVKVPNQGQVTYNTVAGSAGLASFLGFNAQNLFGGGCNGGGLFGWNRNNGNCGCSPYDMPVTRYEMAMQQQLAAKDSEIMELKANIFTDTKIADVYERLSQRIGAAEAILAQQAIRNQGFTDAFRELQKDIDYKVNLEAERRECADCKIVNYVNSTFAPKLITDFAAGTTSAAATTYNPLACGRGCN